jgi:hypothetical protein
MRTESISKVLEGTAFLHIDRPLVIILGHSRTSPENLAVQYLKQPLKEPQSFIDNYIIGKISANFYGTVAYLANKKAIHIMSNIKHAYWCADDWNFYKAIGIEIYNLRPPIAWEMQRNNQSTIGNPPAIHHRLTLGSLLKELRAIVKAQFLRILP